MQWKQIVQRYVSKVVLPLAVVVTLLIWPGLAQSVSAQQAPTQSPVPAPVDTTPASATVRLYLNDILKFDPSSGFTADIFVGFLCDPQCGDLGLVVDNGRATAREQLVDLPLAKAYRMELALTDKIDLHRYPFDSHQLSIVLLSSRPGESFHFTTDEANTRVGDVRLQGWQVASHAEAAAWTDSDDFFAARAVPTYRFSVEIWRPPLAGFFKVIMPGLAILLVGSFGLIIGPDERIKRFDLFNAAFLGTVLFQLGILSSLPPLAYLTFADRFLLINLTSIIVGVASSVLIILAFRSGHKARSWAIHEWSMLVIPLVWFVLQSLNILSMYVLDASNPRLWAIALGALALSAAILTWHRRSMRLRSRFMAAYRRTLGQTRSPKQALAQTLDIFGSHPPLTALSQEELDGLVEIFSALPDPTVLIDIVVEAERTNDTSVLKDRAALERFAAYITSRNGHAEPTFAAPVSSAP